LLYSCIFKSKEKFTLLGTKRFVHSVNYSVFTLMFGSYTRYQTVWSFDQLRCLCPLGHSTYGLCSVPNGWDTPSIRVSSPFCYQTIGPNDPVHNI